MPKRKCRLRKKLASSGICKVAGSAYTHKLQELQELIERLQQQGRAARQQIEASQQREMVLLDLTLHQEQIIALFNHKVLMATCQQQHQHAAQPELRPDAEQHRPALGGDSRLATTAAALQLQAGSPQTQEQAQPQQQFSLQGLYAQPLQQGQQAQVQQQQQQQLQQFKWSTQSTMSGHSRSCNSQEMCQHPQQQWGLKKEQLLEQPTLAAAALESPRQADSLPEQHQQQQQHMQIDTIGYVGSLLQAAAADPTQQQRVLTMTAADWSKFFTESFYKLLLLLELSDRGDEVPCDHMLQQMALAGHRPGGSTVAGGALGGSTAAETTDGISSPPGSHMQQLEQLVDKWVMLSALALIMNPLPIYMATTINHATQVTCSVPPGHFDRVVRRMRLTKQQVRHFAAVFEEFARLDDAVMAQGGQLARHAACPSTVVLAAEAERSPGHAAAAIAEAATPAQSPAAAATFTTAAAVVEEDDNGEEEDMQRTTDAGTAPVAGAVGAGGLAADGSCAVTDTAAAVSALQDSSLQENGGKTADDPPGCPPPDDEGLAPPPAENLLQRHVGRLPLHGLLLMMFNCNTLTKLQLAKCIVSSYPFLPMTGTVAASAAMLWYQHVQQQHEPRHNAQQTAAPLHLRDDEADELCCEGGDAMSEALHKQQLQVLRRRREFLDQQLQQWWQEWSGLGLGN